MNAAVARIVLRYAAGALVAYGMIEADLGKTLAADKDVYGLLLVAVDFAVATLPGLVVGVVSETWYWFAKKFGWRT